MPARSILQYRSLASSIAVPNRAREKLVDKQSGGSNKESPPFPFSCLFIIATA